MDSVENLVFVDGYCHLCHGFLRFTMKRDRAKRFYFSSLQGATAARLIPKYQEAQSIVYLKSGQVFTKSTAALKIISDLGGAWKLMKIFFIIPLFLRNWIYDLVAKSRYTLLGRRETCELKPNPQDLKRILP